MKRHLLLFLVVILLSGCSLEGKVLRIDNYNYKDVMNKVLSLNIKLHNKVSNGYEYYLPKGVIRVDSKSYNDVLKRNDNMYYLYADVVSYYYKSNLSYKTNDSAYYSSLIDVNSKKGYIEIDKVKNKMYVQMYYNYAKIETYVDSKDLTQTVSDMSYILSSIKYNDSLLKKEYDSMESNSKEETYSLFKDKQKEGNFLEYIKEYDKYNGADTKDNTEETRIDVQDGAKNSNEN